MSEIRVVVTGVDGSERSAILSDTVLEGDQPAIVPGTELFRLWGTDGPLLVPGTEAASQSTKFFPPVGGVALFASVVPPDASVEAPPNPTPEMLAEYEATMPGVQDHYDPSGDGFHRSDTVDICQVLRGQIVCEMENGDEAVLEAGNFLIQTGTVHAWHNRGTEPVMLAIVMVGAGRH